MAEDPTAGFSAIAPYLQHPLVLVGFVLLIVVGLFRAFLRSEKVATASQGASGRLLLALARYGFVLALAVILLGFALVFYRDYRGEQARLDNERAVAEAIAGVEARYRARLAELESQGELHEATIRSLNEAVHALAAKAGSPQAPPGVDAALAELARGETAAAERIFAEVLARRSAEGAAANREAAEAARHLGALAYLHDTGKALAAYRRAAELDPTDAWTWIFIARLEARAGRLAAAERAATQARAAAQNAGSERDAMAALHELGDIRVAQGNLTEAKLAYLSAKDVAAKLVAVDPGNAGWQRDLSVSWEKLCDVRVAQGDLAGAAQAYQQTHDILSKLAAADPGNAGWQRDLSVSWNKLGDVRVAQGDLAGAAQAYAASQGIREKLAAADPGNAEWQRDLSVSWNKLGDVRVAQGDLADALQAYEQGRGIREKLAAADPGNAGWQRDLIVSNVKLAEVAVARGERGRAAERYRAALVLAQSLADGGRLAPRDAWMIDELKRRLAAAGQS